MTTHHDHLRTTPQEQQEVPPAWTPETGPQVDHQSPASHKKRGKAAMIVAGILTTAGVGGWFGLDAVTGDTQAKGSGDTDRSTSQSSTGTQETEKTHEVKNRASDISAETITFYGPDGEKLTSVSELTGKVESATVGATDHNEALTRLMEQGLGYIANTGTSKEAVEDFEGLDNDLGGSGPVLTQIERKNNVVPTVVDTMFNDLSDPNLIQNRDEAIELVDSFHASLVDDAVQYYPKSITQGDWRDNMRFVVDTSSIDDEGRHVATGHFVFDGMGVEFKEWGESHIVAAGVAPNEKGGWGFTNFNIEKDPNAQ